MLQRRSAVLVPGLRGHLVEVDETVEFAAALNGGDEEDELFGGDGFVFDFIGDGEGHGGRFVEGRGWVLGGGSLLGVSVVMRGAWVRMGLQVGSGGDF